MIDFARRRLGAVSFAMLGGLAAYGSAELAVRLVRLATVIIIARQLAPDIVGVAALTLSLFELVRVLANIGVGQRIIAAPEEHLAATCNTARRIFWGWCSGIAVVQLIAAALLGLVWHQPTAGMMLGVLALVYFWMPGGLVPCYLLMREGRAGTTARTSAVQTMADHILTACLLLVWQSPWSIVLPKLLTAPIWLVLTRRARPWRADPAAGSVPMADLVGFGLSVLAAELLGAARSQADKLIVGAVLGLTSLGSYYFAFNAGVGIVSSLITAFGTVIYPSLCAAKDAADRRQRLLMAALLGAALFVPLVAAQSLLAPLYVPLVFGARWVHATPLIATLCLAGIPMLAAALTTAWLRTQGQVKRDALAGALSCAASLGGLALGALGWGLQGAAVGWVTGLALIQLPFAVVTLRRHLPAFHLSRPTELAL